MTWILIDSNVCLSVCLEASDICHSRDDSQSKTEKNLDFFGVCPKLLDIGVKLRMNIRCVKLLFSFKSLWEYRNIWAVFVCLGSLFFVFVNDL